MKYVIAGSGAVGLALMDELSRRGAQLVILNRSGTIHEKLPDYTSVFSVDLRNPDEIIPYLDGADAFIHAASCSFPDQITGLPALMKGISHAAESASCALLYVDTMDAYGDNMGIPMSESTPERPGNPIEVLRADLSRSLLRAHSEKKMRVTIARCSDIYGPRVLKGALGEEFFGPVINGKAGKLIGDLDMPHSWTFVRDLARSITILLENDNAQGKIWHVPSPQPVTQNQLMDIIRDMGNRNVQAHAVNSRMIGLKGLFDSSLKAISPFLYRFEKPWLVNYSRFSTTFGERTTSHEHALFETIEWYKRRAGIERRYGF